ncbi:IS1380 family transposase [Bacillus smithii]|uniref:IS1380 family transposase n=3 Tax=Bacillus smithii TaxID=1479 RepID=UPI00065E7F72|nr:IS1380 family transposase [Bacillus smithii]AKP46252.1 Mobile element protein [Bacillus smithii]AKP48031.1 Mobile element protein [Bacillus smithii]AKP48949.1 Mobile element protein [Bacillus smithii]
MKDFPIRFVLTDEAITPSAGLALVGYLLHRTKLDKRVNALRLPTVRREVHISHSDVIRSMIGLLATGKTDFDHIEAYRQDDIFSASMGIQHVPSSPTLRQRLDQLACLPMTETILWEESIRLLIQRHATLSPCWTKGKTTWLPLDIDGSPFDNSDTKKEGVSRTYKGFDGFTPLFAYAGKEGDLVHAELRPGKQHVQDNMPSFLVTAIRRARQLTSSRLLVRMDAGNDAEANGHVCLKEDVDFVIKRNLRRESKALWFQIASQKGKRVDDGQSEGVQTYELCLPQKAAIDGNTYTYVQVTQVTERTMERNGQLMLVPDYEVESYWVRLKGYEHVRMSDVLALYHDHATGEQFHSELKSDLDLERLPSGKMKTNALVLVMGAFVYNLLRLIGQDLLSDPRHPLHHKVKRRRIKTIIQTVITMAGRLVRRSRQIWMKRTRRSGYSEPLLNVYQKWREAR